MTHDALPIPLTLPCDLTAIQSLRAGQPVAITGRLYTGRDRLHRFFYDGATPPVSLANGGLYHCGPVVTRECDRSWRVTAAGPTTSMREEPYMARLIETLGLRIIIGKGGMGSATVSACKRFGCLYIQAVGGAAVTLAQAIKRVHAVWYLDDFGAAEAMWALEVESFEGIVGIDAQGNSLYAQIASASRLALDRLLQAEGE